MRTVEPDPVLEGLQRRLVPHMDAVWARMPRDGQGRLPGSMAITAPAPGAGVTTLATALALSLRGHTSRPVLLVEASSGPGALSTRLQVPGPGCLQYLQGTAEAEAAAARLDGPGDLRVMPAGTDEPGALMAALDQDDGRSAMASLIQTTAMTLFDLGPIEQCAASRQLVHHADVAILLVRQDHTESGPARRALDHLRRTPAAPLVLYNGYRRVLPRWLSGGDPDAP